MRALLSLFILSLPLYAQAEVVVPIESVKSHVNIRMSADAASEIVGKLQQGDALPLVASAGEWHEVKISGGATGYIHADWTLVLDAKPVANTMNEDQPENPEVANESIDSNIADDLDESGTAVTANTKTTDSLAEQDVDANRPAGMSKPGAAFAGDEDDADAALAEVDESEDKAADESAKTTTDAVAQAKGSIPSEVIEEVVIAMTKREVEDRDSQQQHVTDNAEGEQLPEDQESVADEVNIDANDALTVDEVDAIRITDDILNDGLSTITIVRGPPGPRGAMGPPGPAGPPGPETGGKGSTARIEGTVDYLMKFSAPSVGGNSQVFDDGNNVGIGTNDPKQRLEVNGNIQIHERNSSVAGLMITQASGDTGYIMHNQASTLTIGAGSIDRITINRDGNVGIGVTRPTQPMEMASGAYVSAGGVWTNSSSRTRKENIADLTAEEALRALAQLQPVEFNYKNDQQEKYVGFIAEDVPELVATSDRRSLSTMDIVAVLTKVVQEQQKKIAALEARLEQR